MAQHNELGKWGETIAADYLAKKGYTIIDRDWHSGHKDIDIVAQKDDETIVFVEVKTRSNDVFTAPQDAVDYKKMQNLRKSINNYLQSKQIDCDVEFHIIAIVGTPETGYKLDHIADIDVF